VNRDAKPLQVWNRNPCRIENKGIATCVVLKTNAKYTEKRLVPPHSTPAGKDPIHDFYQERIHEEYRKTCVDPRLSHLDHIP
jgi:hypothetical protein